MVTKNDRSSGGSALQVGITVAVCVTWIGAFVAALAGGQIFDGKKLGLFVFASVLAAFGARFTFASNERLRQMADVIGTENVHVARACCAIAAILGVLFATAAVMAD